MKHCEDDSQCAHGQKERTHNSGSRFAQELTHSLIQKGVRFEARSVERGSLFHLSSIELYDVASAISYRHLQESRRVLRISFLRF